MISDTFPLRKPVAHDVMNVYFFKIENDDVKRMFKWTTNQVSPPRGEGFRAQISNLKWFIKYEMFGQYNCTLHSHPLKFPVKESAIFLDYIGLKTTVFQHSLQSVYKGMF